MKTFSLTQRHLLQALGDGHYHTGNELGLALQVSRTAIWKQIKQLVDLGVPIQRSQQQGYRLTTPMPLLNEDAIRDHWRLQGFNHPTHLHLFASIDSTNQFLKDLNVNRAVIDVCCAEMQTHGRGRFSRHWHSPFGENIYCSSRWHFDCDLSRLSGLSLVVSLATLATLQSLGMQTGIGIKWPNDLLWQHKKLCGCLIEIMAESNSRADVIIGIGLNVNSKTNAESSLETPWCSLHDMLGQPTDRNVVIARLLFYLHEFLMEFMQHGFSAFLSRWHAVDYLFDQWITVSHLKGPISGKASGVNDEGQLILEDETGAMHYLSSGDTSLKI